jgi:hypothetical protein
VSETGVIHYEQAGIVLAECARIDNVSHICNALLLVRFVGLAYRCLSSFLSPDGIHHTDRKSWSFGTGG